MPYNRLRNSDHDRRADNGGTIGSPHYTSRLPAEIEDALMAKELDIDKAMKQSVEEIMQVGESYGRKNSERRRLYEEQFLTQLKHDPACKSQHDPQRSVHFTRLQWEWNQYDEHGLRVMRR